MKYNVVLIGVICLVLLGGCLNMGKSKSDESKNEYESENFIPVENYDGEGFTLRNANPKTGEIAEENREEIIAAVEEYFTSNYKTDVNVHNIESAVDAVSVFVESVGDPHFYTFAIVPVDVENEKVNIDEVWTEEGQVENGIQGGLYKMAFAEEFDKLDTFLEKSSKEHPITGTPQAVIEGVKANGYTTPYYFISAFDDVFEDVYEAYMENTDISKAELQSLFMDQSMATDGVSIGIEFYMSGDAEAPEKGVHDQLSTELQEMEGLPKGEYYLFLNDGFIDKKRAIGKKENTIEKTFLVEPN